MPSDKTKSKPIHINRKQRNRLILLFGVLSISSGVMILLGINWPGWINIIFGTLLIGDFVLKNQNRAP